MSRIHKPIDLHAPGAIEELIAFHHSVFGDARMEDEGGESGGEEGASQEGDKTKEGAEGAEGESSNEGGEGNEPDPKEDELPEWAKTKLTKANSEAARYRTSLREAEEKLANAKTPEEVAEIVAGITQKREATELDLLRENVALKHKLPDELAQRLQGKTREELEADAKSLAKFAVSDEGDPDLSGGLSPSEDGDDGEMDPRKLAEKYGPRQRR